MKTIENRDYIREGPYEVLSREFLISRGYCCQSGCRNCPYQIKKSTGNTDGNTDTINTNMIDRRLKIVSFVPSWTETLLAAGGNIIGCTRYCIHPKDLTETCVKVGGTKSFDLHKIQNLKPDVVIMDKEENTKLMSEKCPFPILPSHVCSLEDLQLELETFSHQLQLPDLLSYSLRVNKLLNQTALKTQGISGVLDWWKKPEEDLSHYQLVYLVWKKPFMCITRGTFIGSVLNKLKLGDKLWFPQGRGLYPELELSDLPPKSILLFSSEPYPFAQFKEEYLQSQMPFPAALIDGESFSWFGLRSIRFLEDQFYKD